MKASEKENRQFLVESEKRILLEKVNSRRRIREKFFLFLFTPKAPAIYPNGHSAGCYIGLTVSCGCYIQWTSIVAQ